MMEYLHQQPGDSDPQEGVEPLQASLAPKQSSLPQDHVEAIEENSERPEEVEVVEEAISPQDAEVLAELARLQNQRPPWWRAFAILAISLVLFAGAAQPERTGRGWISVVILIAVLAFHELGHYIAMRCFGYRNLRMFFIPFFGAAVSGRHYSIAGWKKAVVALAGPVPGILIGAPLGLVGVLLREPKVVEVALLLLILNGFNLLPFLPLDGGWVVHAVLFVRHPALDVVFRLVAALCLLGVSLLMGAWLLAALAGFMLLAIPISWRLASVAYRLKQQGYIAVSSDADTIPTSAALSILGELRPALPKQTTARVLAQNVANVFETLNAEPPSLLPSFCLVAVHACSFLLVLVMSVVILVTMMLQRHA
jgi:Zn-dependent protease